MKASECKCVDCGKQAVAFFPVFDPDIPAFPYCRECLDKVKMKLLMLPLTVNYIKWLKVELSEVNLT